MLGSLRARLIVSFAAVVGLAVFLSGAVALFLLRDEQQETTRERYGRLAEPVNEIITAMSGAGRPLSEIQAYADNRAETLDVRILILDEDLYVVYDTNESLANTHVLAFANPNVRVTDLNGARFKQTDFKDLTLFAPPTPPAPIDQGTFEGLQYQALIAVPADELASAWLDLAPRLAIAGVIALTVSFGVAFIISRSISGPLRRITAASQQMARGDFDVHIPIRGQDEVGQLSEAFNHMAQEVSRSQRMMKDLLANVSHELKTPLTSIQGFSQAMLDSVGDEEAARESARIINEEANRMRALVEDLLLLSQIETGQMPMQHAHVDLRLLLTETLERFQFRIRDARIRTGVSIPHLPMVHGDGRRLEQVFSNLIENAVRHTPPEGMISVSASVERDSMVSVTVHNTGSYIPEEDLSRVFERFFQVDRARSRRGGSSGLGLAIVSEIVEAHGGSVRAESDAETGTSFIVTLPNAERQRSRNGRAPAARKKAKRAPRKREAPA